MSLVAKVFIVINGLLSIGLMSLMAILLAHSSDYKVRMETAQRAHGEVVAKQERAKADYDLQAQGLGQNVIQIDNQYNLVNGEITDVQNAKKASDIELDKLKTEIAVLEGKVRDHDKINRDKNTRKAALESELRKVQEQLSQAQGHEQEWLKKLEDEDGKVRQLRSELER